MAYRQKVRAELGPSIQASIPDGLPLLFHGTPVYNVQAILQDGELSSSRDRTGGFTYDAPGRISVTSAATIQWTLDVYTGLEDHEGRLPAGCVFALLPGREVEAAESPNYQMSKFNFNENPKQLFGILTSEENLDMVKQWTADSGLDPSRVYEFFEFPEELERINRQIGNGEMQLQELLPY